MEKSSTASTPVTNPSRSESYTGNIDSYLDLSWSDMAYGSAARGRSGATPNALPDRGRPCETEPAGGEGTFCILASGRGRVLSISSRDAEIGIPGDAYQFTHTISGKKGPSARIFRVSRIRCCRVCTRMRDGNRMSMRIHSHRRVLPTWAIAMSRIDT